jgi:hypothetical protein
VSSWRSPDRFISTRLTIRYSVNRSWRIKTPLHCVSFVKAIMVYFKAILTWLCSPLKVLSSKMDPAEIRLIWYVFQPLLKQFAAEFTWGTVKVVGWPPSLVWSPEGPGITAAPAEAVYSWIYLRSRLWIEKTNVLVDNEDDISRNLKSLGATEIANAVRKKSLAGIETAIRFFETQPRRERDPDR